MWSDSHLDAIEEARYGRAHVDRPICRICHRTIRNDDWRGGPVRGYVCSECHELKREDLQHDADLERVPVEEE